MCTALLGMVLTAFSGDPVIDRGQFVRLMGGLHSPIRDLTAAFEGSMDVGGLGRKMKVERDLLAADFQCRYLFRSSDGAALLDLYERKPRPDGRQTHTLLQNRGGVSFLKSVPDLDKLDGRSTQSKSKPTSGGAAGGLFQPGSPERIIYLWFFQGWMKAPDGDYEFQGWEEIDGHRCLRVELGQYPKAEPPRGMRFRFWIDMERGGHPLKVEYLMGGQAAWRCEHIQLRQFEDARGTSVWLPVSGEAGNLVWQSEKEAGKLDYLDAPVLVESYRIINGSVALNQGMENSDLDLQNQAKQYGEFKDFKKRLEKQRRPPSINPKDVQKRLDEALSAADAQAERLQASSPDSSSWDTISLLSSALPVLGACLIGVAAFWRWRSR